ncbi:MULTISPECIES: endo-1,4-beta-xylanase [Paenibacillus]|uniref:Beta-xylanase n=1 Tax=Paenibacillus albilobatus TaxID=2716884 RepID=A0A919XFL3_9BACL|nr:MULTISPECIES: endo-1,4-beta-xylanase [Paenibacillus]GIO29538.1 beta-xylanase [Paenibacillus albilobatus]
MKKHRIKRSILLMIALVLVLAPLSLGTRLNSASAQQESQGPLSEARAGTSETSNGATSGPGRISKDFEDGTLQGWFGRGGNEILTVSPLAAHTGSYGMQVTGRTQGWNGPQLDVTPIMETGKTYHLSAWVKLPAGTPSSPVSMMVQRTTGGSNTYEAVKSVQAGDSGWVKLSGEYMLQQPIESLAVYFESFDHPTLDFYVDDVVIERAPDPVPIEIQKDIPSLKDVFAGQFKLGTALLVNEIKNPNGPDAELVRKHFNSLTAGNELKWDATEPAEGQFNFTAADNIVNFAMDNGIAMRGHTLVWHSQTPKWVFYDSNGNLASKELLYARMKKHIDAVVGRYKGKIYAWDVVNEVIEPGDKKPGGLRNSLWYQIAGEEFIEKAFIYAHEADPDAKLFINDYNTNDPVKRQFLHDLIKRLKAKGIPVDGVGHQTHIGIEYPRVQELDDMIEAFRDLGIDQQITELDMSVYTNDTDAYETFPTELQIKQANRYREIFDVFRKHADQISAVIFWGKDDLNTWLRTFPVVRNNWPLLFDERLQAKYAYWALVDPSKVPVETKRTKAPEASVKIDGQAEAAWNVAQAVPIQKGGKTAATFKTLWDAGHLYVWVDVDDATVNGNDSVEVYIDGNNGKTNAYEADDKKYTFRRSGANPHKPADYKAVKTERGYRIEASIPIDGAQTGKEIGFDVRIRDRSGSAEELASWNDIHHRQDTDTSGYGVLTLVEGPRTAKAARGSVVIDGNIDEIWNKAEQIVTDRWVSGSSGSTAKVRTLWDDHRLYVLAEVTDSLVTKRSANAWEQDSVEIFIDQNNARTDSYDGDDGQYRVNFDNETSVNPGSLGANLTSAAKRTPTGYIIEAAIDWVGTPPKAGNTIGFDVQVNNDENDDGVRDSVAIWNDTSDRTWQNLSNIGLLTLE